MINTLLIIEGSNSSQNESSSTSRETFVLNMISGMLDRLPLNFDIQKAEIKFPVMYEESLNQVSTFIFLTKQNEYNSTIIGRILHSCFNLYTN